LIVDDDQQYYLGLRSAFASEYAFLIKAQRFHWNVEGRHFYSDHGLFQTIYEEVQEIIDDFAENLRKLQLFAPASLGELSMLSMISDASDGLVAEEMLQVLLDDSDKMVSIFRMMFEIAEEHGDHGLSNFLADRQDAHAKHSWMLRSSLKVLSG